MQVSVKNKILLLTLGGLIAFLITACASKTPSSYYPSRDFRTDKSTSFEAKGTMKPYTINGKTYYPTVVEVGERAEGIASWYGPGFHGKKTSNGETYNQYAFTAAHKTLPMNTVLSVTNLNNGLKTQVRINDRGPFVDNRIIDLSKAAAEQIGMLQSGTAPVRLEVIGFGSVDGTPSRSYNTGDVVNNGRTYEGGVFMVQIGAFRYKEGADKTAKQYSSYQGYKAIVRTSTKDGLNRVFLTGFRSIEEARDFVNSGAFMGAFVVRE